MGGEHGGFFRYTGEWRDRLWSLVGQGLQRLGVEPERPNWHRHPVIGWFYGTSADIIRAERQTPTRADLARRVADALPERTVGLRLRDAEIVEDASEVGWRIKAGWEW